MKDKMLISKYDIKRICAANRYKVPIGYKAGICNMIEYD